MSAEQNFSGDQEMEAAAPVENDQFESTSVVEQQARNVPLDALESERAKRQQLQDEMQMMRDHIAIIQANQSNGQKPKDEFDDISKDDVITYGDLEKILNKKEQQYQSNIQELRMTQKYPDYQQIVTKYLPDVLKQNPGLRDALTKTQDFELAYYLAKNSDAYKSDTKKTKKNADAERIVQNANRAGSLSSVGHTSPINNAKQYKNMSDSDFKAQVQKNLGYY